MYDYYKELEWYLSDGSSIKGEEAYNYLSRKLERYKRISKKIDHILLECLKLNVISDDDSIDINVCETGENLSIIQTELEMLCEELDLITGHHLDGLL